MAKPEKGDDKGGDEKPADAPEGYEGQTLEELHKVATERNLEGRAGLNKADLVKALEKDDRKKAATGTPPKPAK
jgi:hypothetical protein